MKRNLVILSVFILLAGIIYANALNGGFLIDDYAIFRESHRSLKIFLPQFVPDQTRVSSQDSSVPTDMYYRPLSNMVQYLSYIWFEKNVAAYRATNALLLSVGAWLIFLFLRRVWADELMAFLAAFLYLAHPINGIIVNYNTAGIFALELIFIVLALMAAWAHAHGSRHWWLCVASLVFFAIAVLFHESALGLPVYLGALLLWTATGGVSAKNILRRLWPWFMVLVLYLLFRLSHASLLKGVNGWMDRGGLNLLDYAAGLMKLGTWYVSKLFMPQGLVLSYVTPLSGNGASWWVMALVALQVFWCWILWHYRRNSFLRVGFFWLWIGFAPMCVGSLIFSNGFVVEPHWFVFSALGFFMFLAWVLSALIRKQRRIGIVAVVVLVGAWVVLGWSNNWIWKDPRRFCLHWMKEVPGLATPRFYLARTYLAEKDYVRARALYRELLVGQRTDWMVYTNLGFIDLMENHFSEAEANYLNAVKIEPHSAGVYNGLGVVATKQNNWAKAKHYFQQGMDTDPFDITSRLNMGRLLFLQKDVAGAAAVYEQVLANVPDQETALTELLKIRLQQRNITQALGLARRLLRRTHDPVTLSNLAKFFIFYHHDEEARQAQAKLRS